jgi:hypothetical protein
MITSKDSVDHVSATGLSRSLQQTKYETIVSTSLSENTIFKSCFGANFDQQAEHPA